MHLGRYSAALFQGGQSVQLRRRVSVAVIRADHERIFTHATLDQIRHVVADLAGYEDSAALEKIIWQLVVHRIQAAAQFVHHPRHPRRGGFNESEAKLRKQLGYAAIEDPEQCADVKDAVLIEKVAAAVGVDHHVHSRRAAIGLVQPDAKVDLLRLFVQWEKIRVADLPRSLSGRMKTPHPPFSFANFN